MAQRQLANHKLFNSNWTERDEAVYIDLLRRKIGELKHDIAQADSPYVKARLKNKRKEYKSLLLKVESGSYNSNVLAGEMAAYQRAKNQETYRYAGNTGKAAKYVDSYEEINFDFDGYFRKTRYFGTALPAVLLVLTLILTFLLVFSMVMPASVTQSIDAAIGDVFGEDAPRVSLAGPLYYKLKKGDFSVPNNGKWPNAIYAQPESALEYGKVFTDADGATPEMVDLFSDLGMVALVISMEDIAKGTFYTPLLQKYQLTALEDALFPDDSSRGSWYQRFFIAGRIDDLEIKKDENGQWNAVNILNNLGTYGAIICALIVLACCVVELILCVIRLFTYTSRRLHAIPIILFLSLVLMLILPVFGTIPALDNASLSQAFSNYFSFNTADFLASDTATFSVNIVYLILAGFALIMIFVPRMFKNRAFKTVTHVPKGNRAHTFPGQTQPTKPGRVPPPAPAAGARAAAAPSMTGGAPRPQAMHGGMPIAPGQRTSYGGAPNTPYRY